VEEVGFESRADCKIDVVFHYISSSLHSYHTLDRLISLICMLVNNLTFISHMSLLRNRQKNKIDGKWVAPIHGRLTPLQWACRKNIMVGDHVTEAAAHVTWKQGQVFRRRYILWRHTPSDLQPTTRPCLSASTTSQ
jgi:hypothetical protein